MGRFHSMRIGCAIILTCLAIASAHPHLPDPLCPVVPDGVQGDITTLRPCPTTTLAGSNTAVIGVSITKSPSAIVSSKTILPHPTPITVPSDIVNWFHTTASDSFTPADSAKESAGVSLPTSIPNNPSGNGRRGSATTRTSVEDKTSQGDSWTTKPVVFQTVISSMGSPPRTVDETYLPTTFTGLHLSETGTTTLSTLYTEGGHSTTVPIVIFPGGRGWSLPSVGPNIHVPPPGPPRRPAPSHSSTGGKSRGGGGGGGSGSAGGQPTNRPPPGSKPKPSHSSDTAGGNKNSDSSSRKGGHPTSGPVPDRTDPSTTQEGSRTKSASCKTTMTASACRVIVSHIIVITSPTPERTSVSTLSSSCSPTIGCSVSATTTTSTKTSEPTKGATSAYWVFPASETDIATNNAIEATIMSLQDLDPHSVMVTGSQNADIGMVCWDVLLNDTGRDILRKTAGVNSVVIDCGNACVDQLIYDSVLPMPGHVDPTENPGLGNRKRAIDDFTAQVAAKDEMVFLSAYPGEDDAQGNHYGQPLNTYGDRFVYHTSAGADTVVYLVDSGADLTGGNEFDDIRRHPNDAKGRPDRVLRWGGPDFKRHIIGSNTGPRLSEWPSGVPGDLARDRYHGTSMLSKIVGKQNGAAKNVKLVIVRVEGNIKSLRAAFKFILEDWINRRHTTAAGVGIISLASSFPDPGPHLPGDLLHQLQEWSIDLNRCADEGLLLIKSAGNSGKVAKAINTLPTLWASNWAFPNEHPRSGPRVKAMVVVGATDNNGKTMDFSQIWQGPQYSYLGAPGDKLTVVTAEGKTKIQSGTSPATASVAGVAAYIAGLESYRSKKGWTEATPWGQRVADLSKSLQDPKEYAYRRENNGEYPFAIWNGALSQDYKDTCRAAPQGGEGSKARRDNEGSPCDNTERPKPSKTQTPQPTIGVSIFIKEDLKGEGTTLHVFPQYSRTHSVDANNCTAYLASELFKSPPNDKTDISPEPSNAPAENLRAGPFDVDGSMANGKDCVWWGDTQDVGKVGLQYALQPHGKMICGKYSGEWLCGVPQDLWNCNNGKDDPAWLALATCWPPGS